MIEHPKYEVIIRPYEYRLFLQHFLSGGIIEEENNRFSLLIELISHLKYRFRFYSPLKH